MFTIPSWDRVVVYGPEMVNVQSKPVTRDEFPLLSDLREYMLRVMIKHNGMGLAGCQVGIFKNFFIIETDSNDIMDFVNPYIDRMYGLEKKGWEACLSIPSFNNGAYVKRMRTIEISSSTVSDPETRITRKLIGMDAVVAQHEYDHLEGTFFVDRVESLQDKRLVMQALNDWKKKEEQRCKKHFPTTHP